MGAVSLVDRSWHGAVIPTTVGGSKMKPATCCTRWLLAVQKSIHAREAVIHSFLRGSELHF